MIINCIEDYANHLEIPTESGAWITWDDTKMTIGRTVEGREFAKDFPFPTRLNTIEDWLEELEHATDKAWHEVYGWDIVLEPLMDMMIKED